MSKAAGSSAQVQPITTTLRNILKDYPPQTCLRELLQNADDSGATELEFVLDTSRHDCHEVDLINPYLKTYQGPALLARNDQRFTLDDIQSLCKVGDSGKFDDPAVAGKFGRGFNSVYHWTDGPSIYSEDRLLFQDPHEFWDKGGSYFLTTENPEDDDPHCTKAKAHLQAFQCFPFNPANSYDGTIIRIPLRTMEQAETTKIGKKGQPVDIDEIKAFMTDFADELGEAGLLFLKSIRKVTIRFDDKVISETEVLDPEGVVSRARKDLLHHIKNQGFSGVGFEAEIRHAKGDNPEQVSRYAVQHELRPGTGNGTRDSWASRDKLFPWVAVAAPLTPIPPRNQGPKPLFSTLRIQQSVDQPVYLHGLWAITPDRDHLVTSAQAHDWNNYMFTELVVSAWINLLVSRARYSPGAESFGFWPTPTGSTTDPTSRIHEVLVDRVICDRLAIWNTSIGCVNIENAFCADEASAKDSYARHFAAVDMPIAYLRETLLDQAKRSFPNMRPRIPSTATSYLETCETLGFSDPETRQSLLEYCLPSKKYTELGNIPFWPMIDGTFINLQKESVTFFPRSDKEQEIFRRARPDITLDLSALSKKTIGDLRNDISKIGELTSLRYRQASDLKHDWPFLYPLRDLSDDKGFLPRLPESEHVLREIWDWLSGLSERYRMTCGGGMVIYIWDSLAPLFVLPLNYGRIRRMKVPSTSPIAFLNTPQLKCNGLFRRLCDLSDGSVIMLDEELLGDGGTDLVKSFISKVPYARISFVDDLTGLLDFLVSAQDWIPYLQDDDRDTLVDRLYHISKGQPDSSGDPEIRAKFRLLPLFRIATGQAKGVDKDNDGRMCSKWSSLDSGTSYVSIGNLPAVPAKHGATFIELNNTSITLLSRQYGLVQEPHTEQLLEQYVIPGIEGSPELTPAQTALLEYILDVSPGLSNAWKTKLRKFKIIPSQSGRGDGPLQAIDDLFDPESRSLNGLFFRNESVFPASNIFNKYSGILKECGLRGSVTADVIQSRVLHFENCGEPISQILDTVQRLMHIPLTDAELNDSKLRMDLQSRTWIPATFGGEFGLKRPRDCRPIVDRELISHVLSITELQLQPCWTEILGWESVISTHSLLGQLSRAATRFASPTEFKDSCAKVKSTLRYLDYNYPQEEFIEQLKGMCCFPGEDAFYSPSQLFSKAGSRVANLAPHLDRLKNRFVPSRILSSLPIRPEPVLADLLALQQKLPSEDALTDHDLKIAIAILDIASADPNARTAPLKGPDEEGILASIADLTIKSKGHQGGNGSEAFRFAHSDISLDTLYKLEISTEQNRLLQLGLDLDNDEFAPYEDTTTVISECTSRYPTTSTFTEFLANAEDCGATRVSWCIDESSKTPSGFNKDLDCLLGPALTVCNDGVFRDEDFRGLLKIGIGSKFESGDSIGTHGRGVLTMYHFTDTPMILSGSTFLILDPQQNCLPRRGRNGRNERLPGFKIPISRARTLFPEIVALFDGLFGYSTGDHCYNGTIFRLPLRYPHAKSHLVQGHGPISVSGTRNLLKDYRPLAEKSLIFLRNVKTLDFSSRQGMQSVLQWSVVAELSSLKGLLMEELAIRSSSSKIPHALGTDSAPPSSTTKWLVMKDSTSCPPCLDTPRSRINKEISIGLAAPRYPHRGRDKQSIFCTLPTEFTTDLPVSFHATFALSSDRRTIPFKDSARIEDSKWNKWLLLECIPPLYMAFLLEANRLLSSNAYHLWPQLFSDADQISDAVKSAFWDHIADNRFRTRNLFPTVQPSTRLSSDQTKASEKLANVETAYFDFLGSSSSRILTPLFVELFGKVVRLPEGPALAFREHMRTEAYNVIDSKSLCRLLRNEASCTKVGLALTYLRTRRPGSEVELWNHLLLTMIPNYDDSKNKSSECHWSSLSGCRIVPLQNGSLGTLEFNAASPKSCYLLGNNEESSLFSFASDILVDPAFSGQQTVDQTKPSSFSSPSISSQMEKIIGSCSFNVQRIHLHNLHLLLNHSKCPLQSQPSLSGTWLQRLWSYMRPELEQQVRKQSVNGLAAQGNKDSLLQVLRSYSLQNVPFYLSESDGELRFISHETFETRGILKPRPVDQALLCSKIPGLTLVRPDYVPNTLQTLECDLYSQCSFERFLRCLNLLDRPSREVGCLLADSLTHRDLETLQCISLRCLSSFNLQADYVQVLQKLPIFPRAATDWTISSASRDLISLKTANICPGKEMLHPWVTDLKNWMEPTFYSKHIKAFHSLQVKPMAMGTVWQMTKYSFPRVGTEVEEGRRPGYTQFIRELFEKVNPDDLFPLAVDESYKLCLPVSLYDHEEALFKAAFRHDDGKFLHRDIRGLAHKWKVLGLKVFHTGRSDFQIRYRECIQALRCRKTSQHSGSDEFRSDCNEVTNIACQWSTRWSSETGNEIMHAPIFEVKGVAEGEPTYRRARMVQLSTAEYMLAPKDAGRMKYTSVSWSQLAYLKREPVEYLYEICWMYSEPPVDVVLTHLEYLIDIRQEVPESEIPLYLRDLQDTYAFLQDHCSLVRGIAELKSARVWLNLETSDVDRVAKEDLDGSLISANRLCFRCPVDPEPLKFVRSFLTPYEKLLVSLGCESVKQPSIQFNDESPDEVDSPVVGAMRSINEMRTQGQLFDVELSALDHNKRLQTVQAHRLILSACSLYFFKSFNGQWKGGPISLGHPVSYENLLLVIEFMYTGSTDFPSVSEFDNTEAIADKLDSCLDLLRAVDYLQISRLHHLMESHIVRHSRIFIRPDNVRPVLEISTEVGASSLKRYCEEFESANRDVVERCGRLNQDGDTDCSLKGT